jgi:hypothetical protein
MTDDAVRTTNAVVMGVADRRREPRSEKGIPA